MAPVFSYTTSKIASLTRASVKPAKAKEASFKWVNVQLIDFKTTKWSGVFLVLALNMTFAKATQAQVAEGTLSLGQVQGNVEILGANNAWVPQAATSTDISVVTQLRTGTGRAILQAGAKGIVLAGSSSLLRRFKGEADLLSGRFFLQGPIALHVQGNHVVMEGVGQMRVDLDGGKVSRIAVLSGNARAALKGGMVKIAAGKQVYLTTGQIFDFTETDPWYSSQFKGVGDAIIEATRGAVKLTESGKTKIAIMGDKLHRNAA